MHYDLAGGACESRESLGELQHGSWLALLLIFAMMAIPFGIVGAIWDHLMVDLPVSNIALSSVVVNDSLVMVVVAKQKRQSASRYRRRCRLPGQHG